MKATEDMQNTLPAQSEYNKPETVARDLREYIAQLEAEGELVRVTEEVDPLNRELSAFVQHMEDGPNKAVLFENLKGYDGSVIANLYASVHRAAVALGVHATPEQIEELKDKSEASPGGMGGMSSRKFNGFAMDNRSRAEMLLCKEVLRDADQRAYAKECPYVVVDSGPCQEVVHTENIDVLKMVPVPWHLEEDGACYINAAGLVQKDPDNGLLNNGVRRHMVSYDNYPPDEMGVQIGTLTAGGKIMQKYFERGEPAPVAVVVGTDPASAILSTYSSPHYWMDPPYSEFDMTGVISGAPLELVKCKTIDLEVPANAEIVIEGLMPPPPHHKKKEGPMMEFTDYYGVDIKLNPFIKVTAITHRKKPIFHTCMSGNAEEHRIGCIWSYFGYEQMTLTAVKKTFPGVKDIGIFAGSHGFHAVVSMKKSHEGEDRQLLHHLLATEYFKYITIVDDDIDPHNSEQVEWARACRAGKSPDDFVIVPAMPTWEMDPEIDKHLQVTKLGILATRPIDETFKQPTPGKDMMEKMRPIYEKYV